MVVIKIELWPLGSEEHKQELHRGFIINDCSGSQTSGNYMFAFHKKGSPPSPRPNRKMIFKSGQLKGFPRKRKTALELLKMCLSEAYSGGKNEI